MKILLAALAALCFSLPAPAQSPIAAWELRDRHPASGAVYVPERFPVTIASPGLPVPGQKMQVVWRTEVEREYGLLNPSAQPIHWTGYVYSGFRLFVTETATISLNPSGGLYDGALGGFSQWSRTLAGGESYWGPVSAGPYIEGGARDVHVWHLHPWLEGWRFEEPTITLWVEPVVGGGFLSGGHASNVSHLGRHVVTLLRLRNVPE